MSLYTTRKDALSRNNFSIIVDNSRGNGYYRIKHFGFFQGAVVFEVKGSLRKEGAFYFTSNIYVTTPMGAVWPKLSFLKTLLRRNNRMYFAVPRHFNAKLDK